MAIRVFFNGGMTLRETVALHSQIPRSLKGSLFDCQEMELTNADAGDESALSVDIDGGAEALKEKTSSR